MLWISFLKVAEKILSSSFLFIVATYRAVGTTHIGGGCRFEPTCSCYAEQAFRTLPIKKAVYLVIRRLLSCRPGGRFGFDPVPEAAATKGYHGQS